MSVRKWILPLVLVLGLVFVLSLRQLSDPDFGFHLKYGKWIVLNHAVPDHDLSTYSVPDHEYVDLHWLFQVVLYGTFRMGGYSAVSILVCGLSMLLCLLLWVRLRQLKVPLPGAGVALVFTFLIIDPRIAPRPEMFTFLFMITVIMILDNYVTRRKNMLFLIPLVMVPWCNMHALFILGLAILWVYFAGDLLKNRKVDRQLLLWTVISCVACLINPYGIKGIVFPIGLLTRLAPQNIYNQHIQEFIPFFSQPRFVLRDYLVILLMAVYVVFAYLNRARNKPHEYILPVVFGILALCSIRNIPLFVIVTVPIVSKQISDSTAKIKVPKNTWNNIAWVLLMLVPALLIPRLITNAWYRETNSFMKTGTGLNESHQPARAAEFLLKHRLEDRILNSIGFGGWLSWTVPQPVFIDGRLEVMNEPIYYEITESWQNLPKLINRYKPRLIVYNYLKYYPWTRQLRWMSDWRLIYADGFTAIFAVRDAATGIPAFVPCQADPSDIPYVTSKWTQWLRGFYQPVDDASIDRIHLSMFRDQLYPCTRERQPAELAAEFFNKANCKCQRGDYTGALADYDTAILLKSDYYKAYNNRGILRAASFKDYYGAIADFDKAISLNANYAEAYLGRGTSHFLLNNRDLACKDWHFASSLGNVQASRLIELHCNRQ